VAEMRERKALSQTLAIRRDELIAAACIGERELKLLWRTMPLSTREVLSEYSPPSAKINASNFTPRRVAPIRQSETKVARTTNGRENGDLGQVADAPDEIIERLRKSGRLFTVPGVTR